MTNIHEILGSIGLTVPEDKKADFDKAVRENYKTVAEVNKIEVARDNFKSQLDDVQEKLKEFDGVDVKDLNGQIKNLKDDLKNKDEQYQTQLDDIDFDNNVANAIKEAKGKNVKAIRALLDIPTLKKSKNRADDIKTAVNTTKESDGYLFDDVKPAPQITVPGNSRPPITDEKAYLDSFYKGNPFYNK